MTIRVRFAPSPTGELHLGNLRTVIINWLFAKHNDGEFILRIDNTDKSRSTDYYEQTIYDDLSWLGINYDLTFKQSERHISYDKAINKLMKMGYIYPCFETFDELNIKRNIQIKAGKPPIYDRSALQLTKEQIEKFKKDGKKPHYRFKLEYLDVSFNDIIRGAITINTATLSDPILIKQDGTKLYTLTSVVDDGDYNITHILRGADHVTNTVVQILLFKALDLHIPKFAHFSLLSDSNTKKLSKRNRALSVKDFKENKILPQAIFYYCARIGTNIAPSSEDSIEKIIKNFSLTNFSLSTAKSNIEDIKHLSKNILHKISYKDIKSIKHDININEKIWNIIKYNVDNLDDIEVWKNIIDGNIDIDLAKIDPKFFTLLVKTIKSVDFNTQEAWEDISKVMIKSFAQIKPRKIYPMIRYCLTGKNRGPAMHELLPILNFDKLIINLDNLIINLRKINSA